MGQFADWVMARGSPYLAPLRLKTSGV